MTGWPPKLAMNRLTHKNDFFFHRAHARAHATRDSAQFSSSVRAAASEEATLAQAAGCGGAAKSERTSPLRTADPRRRHSCLLNRRVGSCANWAYVPLSEACRAHAHDSAAILFVRMTREC